MGAAIAADCAFDIIQLLFEKGAKDTNDYCFYVACAHNNVEGAHYFYKKGADIYYKGSGVLTSLHAAAENN